MIKFSYMKEIKRSGDIMLFDAGVVGVGSALVLARDPRSVLSEFEVAVVSAGNDSVSVRRASFEWLTTFAFNCERRFL